jgi:hypothetical protein
VARNPDVVREVKARYRERHRETLRVKAREYAERRRRAEGQAINGSAEWLAKRGPDRYLKGEQHPNWKGESASYAAHHHWIKRWGVRTGICSQCGVTPPARGIRTVGTEWANISGQYLRDVSDYVELCPRCHRRRDRG